MNIINQRALWGKHLLTRGNFLIVFVRTCHDDTESNDSMKKQLILSFNSESMDVNVSIEVSCFIEEMLAELNENDEGRKKPFDKIVVEEIKTFPLEGTQ